MVFCFKNADSLSKAKQYSNVRYAFALADTIFILVALFVFQWMGFSKLLARWLAGTVPFNFLALPAYVAIAGAGYYLLNMPIHFYQSYALEHRFSLSRQRISDWIQDELKSIIVSCVISLIVTVVFYRILAWFPETWWLIAALFWIFFTLLLAKLAPVVIIPLFFKYKNLSDEALRSRILNLANAMQVKLLDCFEIDFSKKTLKANAAFTGWGSTRRVILADTLKDKYTHDEIEVILAHEFAHYKSKHLIKLVIFNAASTLILFYLIFRTSLPILHIFGLTSLSDIAAFPILGIYVMVFGIVMQPLGNWVSRSFEREADYLAMQVTAKKEAFISMMEKLSQQNLADRTPHPLIKWYFFDHPPVDERIAFAKHFRAVSK